MTRCKRKPRPLSLGVIVAVNCTRMRRLTTEFIISDLGALRREPDSCKCFNMAFIHSKGSQGSPMKLKIPAGRLVIE